MEALDRCKALTFDVFGTVLDLRGSLGPAISGFLKGKGASATEQQFWSAWRIRQRLEQYQDTILMLGHSGYLETARRAFVYTLGLFGLEASKQEVEEFMQAWRQLSPFSDVIPALERLKSKYRLVALSNGELHYLIHLAEKRIGWDFDGVLSVDMVGAFKPHPGVYRRAAAELGLEVGECMMVSAHTFDILGARACGYRAAFVNRYKLPYEDSIYRPDVVVGDFPELADALL